MKYFIKKVFEELRYLYLCRLKKSKINTDAIVFLGNQKSGTSVISALFSEAANKELTLDFRVRRYIYDDFYLVLNNNIGLNEFMQMHAYEFSKDVIKEPNLSLISKSVLDEYGRDRIVIIVRDPLDNVRSIMERLNLKNDATVGQLDHVNFVWKIICSGLDLPNGKPSNSVFDNLIERWMHIYGMASSLGIRYVRYEDFIDDKVGFIERLCDGLGCNYENDIASKKDKQYQHKGSGIKSIEFFSEAQMVKSRDKCAALLREYGYEI